MTTTAHPFVVARNKMLDWRPLVAPDTLIDAREDYSLVLETGEQHPLPPTVRIWTDRSESRWVLCYRSVEAYPHLVGEDGTDQLTDQFGRMLYLVEGVALRGADEPTTECAAQLLDRGHADAVAAFRDFWGAEDEAAPPRASVPFVADDLVAAVEVPSDDVAPPPPSVTGIAHSPTHAPVRRLSPRLRGLVVLGVAAVLVLAWVIWSMGRSGG